MRPHDILLAQVFADIFVEHSSSALCLSKMSLKESFKLFDSVELKWIECLKNSFIDSFHSATEV